MHLLAATPGAVSDGSDAIDLGQSSGDVVFLSAADTELAVLSHARSAITDKNFPSLRLASLLHLSHNMSVDLYMDQTLSGAKLIIVRLLGGRGYWPYGIEQLSELARKKGIMLALLPGDDQPDAELVDYSTLSPESCHRLWQYCVHGGPDNAQQFLRHAASLVGVDGDWREPTPLLKAGIYGAQSTDALKADWTDGRPVAALVFYRALMQAGNLAAVDGLVAALGDAGLNVMPLYVSSLKDPVAAATLATLFADASPDVILNATGFAVSTPGADTIETPLSAIGVPVLQVVFSGSDMESWRDGQHGLSARDIAMNVALPEVDGNVLSRAVSFKGLDHRDDVCEADIVTYTPVTDRIDFVARLAAKWAGLRNKNPADRKVAIILANYPNRDGRIGNGVGLDTPAGALAALEAMQGAGYQTGDLPADGDALIQRLSEGPTNATDRTKNEQATETLSLEDYRAFFAELPDVTQQRMTERWGAPESDPFMCSGGRFAISAYRLGNVAICLQPARGYNIDPTSSYHDPDLVPPHGYLAFYAWVRRELNADAVIHFGKHGNLEWLPGKSLALSGECYPEAALGPMPNLYPFIVNDPGEGTQAKRRTSAVVIDHLTPPLTRAESYGPLADLESLVDEYYEAAGVDPRRLKVLKKEILTLTAATGLDADCGMTDVEGEDEAFAQLDNYLCELKEMQIRDGLHVFGRSPGGQQLTDLLVALVRVPRGKGEGGDASLLRALADDLQLAFDPLDCDMGTPWDGPRPDVLENEETWRSHGDTVERLENLASKLVAGEAEANTAWSRTAAVLAKLNETIRPAIAVCGDAEIAGLLTGLDGRFVLPGPSGAPTRGRPDVLPTGRNFYSVDTRTVPTPAAWTLGWKSASLLIEHHMQEHGNWPRTMALTAWGTSNMRTGGDDIAQGLALMGVKPTWDTASRRVTGFEILPTSVLDRPRVDVTLRVSGFFRDAFPALIDLFSSAARAVAALDEPESDNPLASRVKAETRRLIEEGADPDTASVRASYRVFGSKPGAYGAGLQALIDEKGWQTEADLARAYVAWGGYAYGEGAGGAAEHGLFETRLKKVEAVVHNQDNREHDLLDSDDYYQFEGGITAAINDLSGARPKVYHNDHSRPETPRIRTLEDEIARVVRARVVNPKWIEGVMRHGYKGAFEMAATVDYLFAFQATAGCVSDHHFDAVFEAYLGDETVRDFITTHNPAALKEMTDRLLEAQTRGLWTPRLNSTREILEGMMP
ncbi:MAG: cobaltochelatase subunit CobN [Rhodospirillaceae bacterium]|jgi:cobaltochelatase CobN|nr:cobaltochelatase subunit CobN [Rhodospirillaceae bacterium]